MGLRIGCTGIGLLLVATLHADTRFHSATIVEAQRLVPDQGRS